VSVHSEHTTRHFRQILFSLGEHTLYSVCVCVSVCVWVFEWAFFLRRKANISFWFSEARPARIAFFYISCRFEAHNVRPAKMQGIGFSLLISPFFFGWDCFSRCTRGALNPPPPAHPFSCQHGPLGFLQEGEGVEWWWEGPWLEWINCGWKSRLRLRAVISAYNDWNG
jgi:hypothetical protein